MGRPRLQDSDVATTARLLTAAEAEFGRAGYHAARLEDIARGAGITRSSLLYHWPSKDALYGAVVHAGFGRLGQALAAAMARCGDFDQRLDALVTGFLEFLQAAPAFPALCLREVLDGQGPGHRLLLSEVAPVLSEVERFVRAAGRGRIRARLPVRAALMQIVSSGLLRAAAGDLAVPLWGRKDMTRELALLLVLEVRPSAAILVPPSGGREGSLRDREE